MRPRPLIPVALAAFAMACGHGGTLDAADDAQPPEFTLGEDDGGSFDLGADPPPPSFSDGSLDLGDTVTASPTPPPISGGTLAIAPDGRTAVVADPDRDRIAFVDVERRVLLGVTSLSAGDEPGRVAFDDGGNTYVVLRRAGTIVKLSLSTREVVARSAVCPAPRGIAFDPSRASIIVACAGGELVFLPTRSTAAPRVTRIDPDLRDVLVSAGRVFVSRFRAAELLEIGPDGRVASRRAPAPLDPGASAAGARPAVAWRSIVTAQGSVLMLHQRASTGELSSFGGYYHDGGIVTGTAAVFPSDGSPATGGGAFSRIVLPVDIASSPDGKRLAVVGPGGTHVRDRVTLLTASLAEFTSVSPASRTLETAVWGRIYGEPIAVAFSPRGLLVVQSREPSALVVDGTAIPLGGVSRRDTGHALFHTAVGRFGGAACASCHPEGGDDGATWKFEKLGLRRTQSLRGGLLETAPFHWEGDMHTLADLIDEVWVKRMAGPGLFPREIDALAHFLDGIPDVPASPALDPIAAARGKRLFESASVGCATCHSAPRLTNNTSANVGTGLSLQVSSLRGLALRAPFMHNGCAPTLFDRFTSCGGGEAHGHTAHLAAPQVEDLVAYLTGL